MRHTQEKEPSAAKQQIQLNRERNRLLYRLQAILEGPMVVLGFVWLLLLVIDLTRGLSPFLQNASTIIWIIFILDFLLKFVLAPHKKSFLRSNILTIVSLVVPALRLFRLTQVFRIMRTLRATRSLRLVKVVGSLNRGLRSLSASMGRRGFGYVVASSALVTLLGSLGMHVFENGTENGFRNYGEALWWTLMLLSSLGSEYWPQTPEGRVLCFLLAMFGLAVFGYFTATLATYFMGRDAEEEKGELAGAKQIQALQQEVRALRQDIQLLLAQRQETKAPPEPRSD
jgi:voltage-gated potassium channel